MFKQLWTSLEFQLIKYVTRMSSPASQTNCKRNDLYNLFVDQITQEIPVTNSTFSPLLFHEKMRDAPHFRMTRFPSIFNFFSMLFQYLFNTKLKKFNTQGFHAFSKNFFHAFSIPFQYQIKKVQ